MVFETLLTVAGGVFASLIAIGLQELYRYLDRRRQLLAMRQAIVNCARWAERQVFLVDYGGGSGWGEQFLPSNALERLLVAASRSGLLTYREAVQIEDVLVKSRLGQGVNPTSSYELGRTLGLVNSLQELDWLGFVVISRFTWRISDQRFSHVEWPYPNVMTIAPALGDAFVDSPPENWRTRWRRWLTGRAAGPTGTLP